MPGDINVDVGSVITGIGTLAKNIREAITGEAIIDPNKKADIEMKVLELENAALLAQTGINQAEAASPNLFVSGWRPAAGWVCVIGFFYTFIIRPFAAWYSTYLNITVPPEIDAQTLMNLLLGMLGLAGFRTWEGLQGVKRVK
jgi:hypothetical protein